jgi:hypothetical protein
MDHGMRTSAGRRGERRLTALVAIAIAILLMGAAPAQATTFEVDHTVTSGWVVGSGDACVHNTPYTALGCFRPTGDHFMLGDAAKDNASVGFYYNVDYGRTGLCIDSAGKDIPPYPLVNEGGQQCNKNFLEGHLISFKVGQCDGNCGTLSSWYNWSGLVTTRT